MNLLASTSTETFTPEQLFAGDMDIETIPVTVASGQNLAQYTVVGRLTANGHYAAHDASAGDGSEVPVGILVNAINASGGAAAGTIYVAGCFNIDALVFDPALNTDALKLPIFLGTNITLKKLAYSVG